MTDTGRVPADYKLENRYKADEGTVILSGIQALARIPIEQLRRDHANGHNSAAFISGYPGSPLGGFDQELARALRLVDHLPIVHQPAVNEELGASAVMGSQLVATRADANVDGVVGIWYGKAPGLDRATDALRHAVFAGSSAGGGALALVGDDPAAKSSTMPSSSDAALVDLHMPILYPATIAECIELGLHGIAMSRATGLWSAMKIVTPIADGSATVTLPALVDAPVIPTVEIDGQIWKPHPSAQFLGPRMVEVEKEFHEVRSELARRYGIENKLNRVTVDPADAWLGIIATGYTYSQVIESFHRLGLTSLDAIGQAGIRLLQLRMPVPYDRAQVVDFARGLDEIFVIEEKNPTLEQMVRDTLYSTSLRPEVVGKFTTSGEHLLPSYGRLDADEITGPLRQRLAPTIGDRLAPPPPPPRQLIPLAVNRAPFFCSGCPHNWGTKAPEGAVVGMGTGCHGMTLLMDEDRVGESIGITAMGNEGTQWIGMSPFVDTDHVFQNLGDGTYFHSAQLAIQAAQGAGVNMTFKLLYNDTVAMTGGQETSHRIGVPAIVRILLEQGVAEVAVTSDDVDQYKRGTFPRGVEVADRTRIVEVQERLAKVPGVTVLIHDQECAAELRRDRKRGRIAKPTTRVVINHRICEGCGDCGDVSNCLSVRPIDTPLGRKTTIDQASCNLDLSCLHGDCPAFMTVDVDDRPSPRMVPPPSGIADPIINVGTLSPDAATVIRMTGIGGTGVVTAAQVLATAAMLAGWETDGLDQTGLSQKAGPVISDLSISPTLTTPTSRRSNLIGGRQATVLLAFDQMVAASAGAIAASDERLTAVVASTSVTPTGSQVVSPQTGSETPSELSSILAAASDSDRQWSVDATAAATILTGTAATANTLLIGVALQAGVIPVPVEFVRQAIELNGVAVDLNLAALEWGRWWVADQATVRNQIAELDVHTPAFTPAPPPAAHLSRIRNLAISDESAARVADLTGDLVEYQDAELGSTFLDLLELTAKRSPELVEPVAVGYHKLLAYKDEYEVARLMLHPDGVRPAQALGKSLRWHLHPPFLAALGLDRKLGIDHRTKPAFSALAKGKRLRGSRFDPFGRTELRRAERELPGLYADAISKAVASADDDAVRRIAALPDLVRGYESLKLRRIGEFRSALDLVVSQVD